MSASVPIASTNASYIIFLWARSLLNRRKILNGKQVVQGKSRSDRTISHYDLAGELLDAVVNYKFDMYFPRETSNSVDIFIIPPIEDEKIIIGIQVKCSKSRSDTTIGTADLCKEVRKFHSTISYVRARSTDKKIKAVFILCSTCSLVKGDFPEMNGHQGSFLWMNPQAQKMGIEVFIMNLTTPELRKEFFELTLPEKSREEGMELVEKIVNYSARTDSDKNTNA
jgi:hypothetical protein